MSARPEAADVAERVRRGPKAAVSIMSWYGWGDNKG